MKMLIVYFEKFKVQLTANSCGIIAVCLFVFLKRERK